MGQAGIELLGSANAPAIRDALDRLYCGHLVAVHVCLGVQNRLAGPPLFLLSDELEEVLGQNLKSARRLGQRLSELDGAVTADPGNLGSRAGVATFQLQDCSDLHAILSAALSGVRDIIRAYAACLELSKGDVVTTQLLVELVQLEIARESDLEAAATRPEPGVTKG